MPFSRRDLAAARAFADSVVSGGGVGKPKRAPSSWSDAYLIRVTNAWQRQAAAGEPMSLQAARRGPVTYARPGRGEHPRQRHIGGGSTAHHGADRSGYEVREYRSLAAMRRWVERRIPGYPDTWVQITAHGRPITGYDPVADKLNADDTREGDFRVWRILATAPGGDIPWDDVRDGVHYPDGRPLFDDVTGYEVRWGDAIREVSEAGYLYPAGPDDDGEE